MIRRPPTLARGGMVAASHPLAAEAGAAMLRRGGHAVDAVLATAAALAVVEPWASGLGGDAFFLIYDQSDGAVTAINGSGPAPARLTPDRFAGQTSVPLRGALSAAVPGCVAAWGEAWYGWSRLEWSDLLAPAVRLAEGGFPVSWRMGKALHKEREVLASDPALSRLYLHPDGTALAAAEICRPEALARTLKLLARDGAGCFYTGGIAERLCRGVKEAGGVLSTEDLGQFECDLRPPYEIALDDLTVCEQPLPSQGILLLIMLGLLQEAETQDPATGRGPGRAGPDSREELHRQIESKKIAFALRDALLTDPVSLPVSERELVATLLGTDTLRGLSRLLDEGLLPPTLAAETTLGLLEGSGPAGRALLDRYRASGFDLGLGAAGFAGTDTTYLCAADGEGNVVGLIQSVFHPFGCGFQEPGTGILLNNRAAGFSLQPGHINRLEPGKRTLHTLNSYLILRDGRPWMVGGTPGADNQVQTSLQVLRHIIAGRPLWPGPPPMAAGKWTQARLKPDRERLPEPELLAAALEAPRWRAEPDGLVRLEARIPADVRRRLRKLGHAAVQIGPWEGSGLVQAIRCLPDGVLLGATDPRGEGLVLGL